MNDTVKLVSTFVDAVALIMALVLMVSILQRTMQRRIKSSLVLGALFSFAVFLSMSDPIDLGSAGIFDMRGLLIGTAAAVLGPIVGVMTLLTGLTMRLAIGGNGLMPGLISMLLAFSGGILWRIYVKDLTFATWKKSIVLGLMITSQSLAILFAPAAIWGELVVSLLPYTLVSNVLGAVLINHLISGELSFLSEAESSKVEANTDPLTGLLNRRGLNLIFPDLARQRANNRGRAMLCFDIDHFKGINDTHGHGLGDAVLRYISDQVSQNLRPHDIFARLGGDEFTILLNNIDRQEAEKIAERCRVVVAEGGFSYRGKNVPVTISLGAVWVVAPIEIDQLLGEADEALYAAKSKGRNTVVFKYGRTKAAPDTALQFA